MHSPKKKRGARDSPRRALARCNADREGGDRERRHHQEGRLGRDPLEVRLVHHVWRCDAVRDEKRPDPVERKQDRDRLLGADIIEEGGADWKENHDDVLAEVDVHDVVAVSWDGMGRAWNRQLRTV